MRPRVEVLNKLSRRLVLAPIRIAVEEALRDHPGSEACVVVGNNEGIRELNRQYRGIDEATDVLSFPAQPNPRHHLGDIVLSWEYAEMKAKIRKVRPVEEAAMLAVHGALHLLGMDDQTEPERLEMVHRANQIIDAVGLPTDEHWASLPH